jgi:hypothetical protein
MFILVSDRHWKVEDNLPLIFVQILQPIIYLYLFLKV